MKWLRETIPHLPSYDHMYSVVVLCVHMNKQKIRLEKEIYRLWTGKKTNAITIDPFPGPGLSVLLVVTTYGHEHALCLFPYLCECVDFWWSFYTQRHFRRMISLCNNLESTAFLQSWPRHRLRSRCLFPYYSWSTP